MVVNFDQMNHQTTAYQIQFYKVIFIEAFVLAQAIRFLLDVGSAISLLHGDNLETNFDRVHKCVLIWLKKMLLDYSR